MHTSIAVPLELPILDVQDALTLSGFSTEELFARAAIARKERMKSLLVRS